MPEGKGAFFITISSTQRSLPTAWAATAAMGPAAAARGWRELSILSSRHLQPFQAPKHPRRGWFTARRVSSLWLLPTLPVQKNPALC